jgi:hypothetical protein
MASLDSSPPKVLDIVMYPEENLHETTVIQPHFPGDKKKCFKAMCCVK